MRQWRSRPSTSAEEFRGYRDDPVAYAREVLRVAWWHKQQEVAAALIRHRRVMVAASHSVGKSHLGGGLINWHYDVWDPGLTLTTAPTAQGVKDVLWKEVRVQRGGRPGLQPKAPRLESSADHFAVGYTARDDASFQGRHDEHVLIVFDEAVGIDAPFWDAAEGMMTSGGAYWLAIFNPTDTASRAYEEWLSDRWHLVSISALDHPNIAAELRGEEPPFPAAVRLGWVNDRVQQWCTPIAAGDRKAGDLEWPPGSGAWVRPGPLAESRLLGRWPSQGSVSVWTEAMWEASLTQRPLPQEPTEIGCDVARFGDDFTSIAVRRGGAALHHETHNGWSTDQTAGRLKQLCGLHKQPGEDPKRIAVKVDDDGVGGGVTDQRGEYNFLAVSGASKALQEEDYPNRRSELWFTVAGRADKGDLDLSRLAPASLSLLRRQAMAPRWKVDSAGRRVVEAKDETKKRIGRSPDDMDALNLSFARGLQRTVWAW